MTDLPSPYPYFGGKSVVSAEIWRRLGDLKVYVEPFFGSGAVWLARPKADEGHLERLNDDIVTCMGIGSKHHKDRRFRRLLGME